MSVAMNQKNQLHFGSKTAPLHATHEALFDVWRRADSLLVFEHAWLNDHFMALGPNPAGPCLGSWTLLAALAAVTQRLRIGVTVSGNTYRYPALPAKMAATVDIVSHGRLNFTLRTGWSEREHRAYGIPLPSLGERVRRLEEACELIRRLWLEPVANFAGRYYQLHEAYCEPKLVQQPHPPVAVGAEGARTLRVATRYAQVWDCSVATVEEYRQKSALLDSYCADIGRDPASIQPSRHISVDPSDLAAAHRETQAFTEAGANHIIYHLLVPDTMSTLRRLAEEVGAPLHASHEG
jgi:alkanesulfonate monooxygenase SsuD/methylene tetrahydromethanopterin reductase-like flavin-dependent oxidoreductase (luciferase family)